MSPDWSAKASPVPYADLNDPQTLNLYEYVKNNPLSRADADGHCYPVCTVLGGAAAGYLIGAGSEIIAQKLHGQSIDLKKANASGVKGAITGAAVGFAGSEAGIAVTAAPGAAGSVGGGIAGRSIEDKSASDVFSPKAIAADTATGTLGGAIAGAKVGKAVGEYVVQESAKIATASGDQQAASFFSSNAAVVVAAVDGGLSLARSTVVADIKKSADTKPQQEPTQKP